jgi:hypothetical protein
MLTISEITAASRKDERVSIDVTHFGIARTAEDKIDIGSPFVIEKVAQSSGQRGLRSSQTCKWAFIRRKILLDGILDGDHVL